MLSCPCDPPCRHRTGGAAPGLLVRATHPEPAAGPHHPERRERRVALLRPSDAVPNRGLRFRHAQLRGLRLLQAAAKRVFRALDRIEPALKPVEKLEHCQIAKSGCPVLLHIPVHLPTRVRRTSPFPAEISRGSAFPIRMGRWHAICSLAVSSTGSSCATGWRGKKWNGGSAGLAPRHPMPVRTRVGKTTRTTRTTGRTRPRRPRRTNHRPRP